MPVPDITVALTVSTLAALWVGWIWKLRPWVRHTGERISAFLDTFNGREEFVDPTSGKVVSRVEPLGHRLGQLETTVATLVDQDRRLTRLEEEHIRHGGRLSVAESAIYDLQKARNERMVTKAEAAQFYRLLADQMHLPDADPIHPPKEFPNDDPAD